MKTNWPEVKQRMKQVYNTWSEKQLRDEFLFWKEQSYSNEAIAHMNAVNEIAREKHSTDLTGRWGRNWD